MKTKPNWAEDLKNRDVKVLEVQESKFGKEPRELTVIKGELLEASIFILFIFFIKARKERLKGNENFLGVYKRGRF